jgi:superfamily II DNA or RNA helicase
VTAAALIARRGVNTLVLVHRAELLKQWRERLRVYLDVGKEIVATIGGGLTKPTGRIDIALMQSISRHGEVDTLVEDYGHVIVDECHHVGAVSFDAILRRVRARYVLGLTATPIRRDGQQPIIFMQCGPIRHAAARPADAPADLLVIPHFLDRHIVLTPQAGIQHGFRHLAEDPERTAAIAGEVSCLYGQGRKLLVLTERTGHLDAIMAALNGRVPSPFVLAMPVSWKGTLQQYAGRLHRQHAAKTSVLIVDFVDTGHPALVRMWERRQRGYRAMGYRW